MTASETFQKAMSKEFDEGDLAEAITLYEAAAQMYIEEKLPEEARVCQEMADIVKEVVHDRSRQLSDIRK